MDREQATAIIRSSELAANAERLEADLEESVRLYPQAMQMAMLELGESRLGGCPDLPPRFEWPRCIGSTVIRPQPNEVYLNFLAQICLDDLPAFEGRSMLPSHGWLCFFYDCEHSPWGFDPATRAGWRVIYFDLPRGELERTAHPPVVDEMASAPARLVFAAEWTLPDAAIYGWEWFDALQRLTVQLNGSPAPDKPIHRLLGHAQHLQGDMRIGCQIAIDSLNCDDDETYDDARVQTAAEDWRLLLQLDSDLEGPPCMTWGDCGRVYYWIKDGDLRRLAFDQAWFALQCS